MARAGSDPYYSRAGTHGELADRQDPVVWATEPGPLDAAELVSFTASGFVIKRDLFGAAEVAEIAAEADHLAKVAVRGRDDVICEPDSDIVRSLFRVHRDSQVMRRLATDRRMVGIARQILGDDVYIHQSRINFKPAFEGKSFPWHADFETWHIEDGMPRMRALSASLLLTPNTAHNGPLMVIPGSHHRYVRCVGATPPDHFRESLRRQQYGVPAPEALTELVRDGGIVSATGAPGAVVFFDCNLMHGSSSNITPMGRNNVFLVYNSAMNRLVEPFGGTPPRPAFLAEREAVPLSRGA